MRHFDRGVSPHDQFVRRVVEPFGKPPIRRERVLARLGLMGEGPHALGLEIAPRRIRDFEITNAIVDDSKERPIEIKPMAAEHAARFEGAERGEKVSQELNNAVVRRHEDRL